MNDELYMQRCLELAQKAKGNTEPNPMVGAVLVYNDRIIGEGYHQHYGQAHAEVNCIDSVADTDRQRIPESTMYVNLEPCVHHGKTPPCANRIVAEGIKKVVIANTDPFEKVSGRGIQILKDAGVEVATGILDKEAAWVNRRFFCFHQHKRPYIILKWAQTKDGYIAPLDGSRFQISNNLSTRLVHKWRTEEGAIMIGTNTALNDDPQLTARHWQGKQPLRIVLDKQLRLPETLQIYNDAASTWIVNEIEEAKQSNIHFIRLNFDNTLLSSILEKLHQANTLSIIVEGGANLLNSFIEQELWDEARIFTGDTILPNGIAAPLLQNSVPAFQSEIGTDALAVFTNKNNKYAYTQGLEL